MSSTEQLLQRMADQIDQLKRGQEFPWWEKPVLTSEEARIYVGDHSPKTFYDRMRRWGVNQCEPGLWPRHKIDGAMNRIRRNTFQSRRGRPRATA
jgi:hypothetical protein